MKGFRFYEEYKTKADKRKKKSAGNVVAVFIDPEHRQVIYYPAAANDPEKYPEHYEAVTEALSGIFDHPDSPVNLGSVSLDYLRDKCRRISEKRAREIHPQLFIRLDEAEQLEKEEAKKSA